MNISQSKIGLQGYVMEKSCKLRNRYNTLTTSKFVTNKESIFFQLKYFTETDFSIKEIIEYSHTCQEKTLWDKQNLLNFKTVLKRAFSIDLF